jgi:hypothetical protein
MYRMESIHESLKNYVDELAAAAVKFHEQIAAQMSQPDLYKYSEIKNNIDALIHYTEYMHTETDNICDYLENLKEEVEICMENVDDGPIAVNFDAQGSWVEEQNREETLNSYKKKYTKKKSGKKSHKTINSYKKVEFGSDIKLTVVSEFEDMEPCLYYKIGKNEGIYVCIAEDFYVEMPMSNIDFSGTPLNVARCECGTSEECEKLRHSENSSSFSQRLNKIKKKNCISVHRGETFNRIGHFDRCAFKQFGSFETLQKDMDKIDVCGIKNILMHALNDMFLAAIWQQRHKKSIILHDINIAV